MNSAINNALQQYLDTFMDTVAERFDINRNQLDEMWKETQKKKFAPKKKSSKRKKSSVPSAYILFCRDERVKIKNDHPDLTFVGMAKELGDRWKKASDSVKEHFKKQHDILIQQHEKDNQETTNPPLTDDEVSVSIDEEDVIAAATTQLDEEPEKPKKSKKPKTVEIPDDITNERERDLWVEFAKLSIAELRTQCDHNNIKKSKNRNDMIHALAVHRIALEDGNTQIDSDEED
jgi:hypothetical protein